MKKSLILLGLATASLMSATVVTPDSVWVTLPNAGGPVGTTGAKITNDGGGAGDAYWNNNTEDNVNPAGSCANIGCYITATGAFAGQGAGNPATGLINPVYLAANATGTTAESFSFDPAGNSGSSTLEFEVAGFAPRNWLGWYDTTAINSAADFTLANYNLGKWGIMYTGGQGAGAGSFTPSSSFGLWLLPDFQTTVPNDTSNPTGITQVAAGLASNGVFTEDGMNAGDVTTAQHFALFARNANPTIPAEFWLGVEDKDFVAQAADKDYNDMIVHLRVTPEPGYYVMLSLGLAGLGIVRRRLNKTAKAA